ncbi:hypothetical protein [Dapis sp. BLCC M229]
MSEIGFVFVVSNKRDRKPSRCLRTDSIHPKFPLPFLEFPKKAIAFLVE